MTDSTILSNFSSLKQYRHKRDISAEYTHFDTLNNII